MRVQFDQGTPAPLRRSLTGHTVSTAYEMGWTELDNGALLRAAESDFDALVTTDKSLRYQQNLAGRPWRSWCCRRRAGRPSEPTRRKSPPRSTRSGPAILSSWPSRSVDMRPGGVERRPVRTCVRTRHLGIGRQAERAVCLLVRLGEGQLGSEAERPGDRVRPREQLGGQARTELHRLAGGTTASRRRRPHGRRPRAHRRTARAAGTSPFRAGT
jgi:hypothetical protein